MISKLINKLTTGDDQIFEKLASNPVFLKYISQALNASHASKTIIDNSLNAAWEKLQLSNRKDQERLQKRIASLELRITKLESQNDTTSEPSDS